MKEESGKFIVVDASNIGAIFEQVKKWADKERMKPAQHVRPCEGCQQIMANQAASVKFVNGVPKFYCEGCTATVYE